MYSILFRPEATDLQISSVRRHLMNGGAASVDLLADGNRRVIIFDDPAGLLVSRFGLKSWQARKAVDRARKMQLYRRVHG